MTAWLLCKFKELQAQLNSHTHPDSDEQILSLDGCDLSISNGNTIDLGGAIPNVVIYRLSQPTNGVNVRFWNGGDGDSVAHDNVDIIFNGATDSTTGFPTHPNTPTASGIEADWVISTNNILGTAYPSDGSDQLEG